MNKQNSPKNNYGPEHIGNVIRILDNRTLLVNTGSSRLKKGDKIKVYTPVEPLYNLDGSILCMYEYTKDTLEVIDTNKKYSICQKMDTQVVEPATLAVVAGTLAVSPLFNEKKEYVPLNLNEEDISPIKINDPKIRIGDPIKLA